MKTNHSAEKKNKKRSMETYKYSFNFQITKYTFNKFKNLYNNGIELATLKTQN